MPDDTAKLQNDIDSALTGGQPLTIQPGVYNISDTLRLVSPNNQTHRLNINAEGVTLRWVGPPNQSVIYAKGWKYATVKGLEIVVVAADGVTAWDMGTPDDAPSLSGIVFQNCRVTFGGAGGVGWRAGVDGNLYGDVSALVFQGCVVDGGNRANGCIGWQALRYNCISWTWNGGGALRCQHAFSNFNGQPGATQHGGASMSFYGFSPSGNDTDFRFHSGGAYLISGGRYELGKRMVVAGANADAYGVHVKIESANISTYTPDDGVVFDLQTAATLSLEDCTINRWGGADYDERLITANSSGYGAIRIAGGGIQLTGQPYTREVGDWDVSITGVSRFGSNVATVGYLTNE